MSERDALRKRLAEEHLPSISEAVTDMVFRVAWEEGHASGEHEVSNYYAEMAEFAKAAYDEGYESGYAEKSERP